MSTSTVYDTPARRPVPDFIAPPLADALSSSSNAPNRSPGRAIRTTITLPDPLFQRAKQLTGGNSFSEFVRQAIVDRVKNAERERLSREMEEGYRQEAQTPTLDPAWTSIETEDW